MDNNGIAYESTASVDLSPDEDLVLDERAIQVYCWRMERLIDAGYNQLVADLLAVAPGVDLHQAVDLLGSGCPPQTAVRILL
jgi:hypothetical protein